MRVLITGATGFIGTAITQTLIDRDHEVIAAVRRASVPPQLASLGCKTLKGSLTDARHWLPRAGEIDAIIHAAATFDDDMESAERSFLEDVAAWAGTRDKPLGFVYTGGVWLYGPTGDDAAVEGMDFHPGEDFAFMVAHRDWLFAQDKLAVSVVHPALVWDETGGALGDLLEAAQAGEPATIIGDGANRWPLVHRADLALLYVLAAEQAADGADYHGVGDRGIPVREIADRIAAGAGAPPPSEQSLEDAREEMGGFADYLSWDQCMEAPASRKELGWQPERFFDTAFPA